MSYQIEYCGAIAKKTVREHTITRKSKSAVVAIAVIIVSCLCAYFLGHDHLYEILIPGDPGVTAAAAKRFVQDLQQGSSMVDAFGIFCKEIIHGAIY